MFHILLLNRIIEHILSKVGVNMLLSAISSSAVNAIVTTPSLPQYGSLVVAGLLVLLSLKEVLSLSKLWNQNLNSSFNLVISPFVLCFTAIVAYKVGAII